MKHQLDEKSLRERKRVTLNEVSTRTGISRATLTRIANIPGYNTSTDNIDALCRYFECGPAELLELSEDEHA